MEKLANFLESLPDQKFYMGTWISLVPDGMEPDACMTKKEALSCGTACCIAGWAVFLANKRLCIGNDTVETASGRPLGSVSAWAQSYLGLTDDEADRLFYLSRWPVEYRFDRYGDWSSMGYKDSTKNAAERIRHMIQTRT